MKLYAAVAIGGALGAAARYGIGLWLGTPAGSGWPAGTMLCNLLGSFVLGALNGYAAKMAVSKLWTEGIGTGIIGSFTTFSALSVETVQLIRNGNAGLAAGYIGASIAGGLLLAALGFAAGARLGGKPE